MMSEITNRMRKIKNMIRAISAAATAMPVNPKIAAMMAIMRNDMTQPNI